MWNIYIFNSVNIAKKDWWCNRDIYLILPSANFHLLPDNNELLIIKDIENVKNIWNCPISAKILSFVEAYGE